MSRSESGCLPGEYVKVVANFIISRAPMDNRVEAKSSQTLRMILPLTAVLAVTMILPASADASPLRAASDSPTTEQQITFAQAPEVMIDESFDVSAGELLLVSVPDADVVIKSSNGNRARIVVTLEGSNMSKAREYYEKQRISATYEGNAVKVLSARERRDRQFRISWNSGMRTRIVVTAYVPERFDVDVATSDGDVQAGNLFGDIQVRTSDGDVVVENVSGPSISIKSSDGDIATGKLEADVIRIRTSDGDLGFASVISPDAEIVSSDGDIRLGRFEGSGAVRTSDGTVVMDVINGRDVTVRTSDGDIHIGSALVQSISVNTSDGDIRIDGIDGAVDAVSSDGDVYVSFDKASAANIRVSDGDIVLVGARSMGVDVDLSGQHVRVAADFDFSGQVEKRSAGGKLNGGGPVVRARSADGTVYFRTL